MRVCRVFAAVLVLAGAATADEPEPRRPQRRPEPVPFRLQSPLLRRLHLPAPAPAAALSPDEAQFFGLFNVAVFRESDAGAPGSNNSVSLVGDHVGGIGRLRLGGPLLGDWVRRLPGHVRTEIGVEYGYLRWGRSPKFTQGPDLDATFRGATWMRIHDATSAPLDPVWWWRAAIGAPHDVSGALQLSGSLPTGSRSRGTGAGTVGAAVTAMFGTRLVEGLFLDLNYSVVFPRRPRALGGGNVRVATIHQGVAALSWSPIPGWTLNLQAVVASNPFPDSDVRRLDEPIGEILVAAQWRPWRGLAVGLTFVEDLTRLSPDFSAGLFLRLEMRER